MEGGVAKDPTVLPSLPEHRISFLVIHQSEEGATSFPVKSTQHPALEVPLPLWI